MPKAKKADAANAPVLPAERPLGIGAEQAAQFGQLVRERRKALKMSQDELALVTGVGRRFIVELEGGKPSSQLGRALAVADALGLRFLDRLLGDDSDDNALLPDLPDIDDLPP